MLILGLVLLLTTVSAQCFCREDQKVQPNSSSICDRGQGLGPCGPPSSTDTGFVQCCHPGDACGADGFCHFRITLKGTSQYYMGGCTDPKFTDPSCPRQCTSYASQDVVYNPSTGLWACCWNNTAGAPDCSNPTLDTFEASAPGDLTTGIWASVTAVSSIPPESSTSTRISASTSDPSTTSSAASPTQTNTETSTNTPSDLSTGAKAGIGIGAAAAFIVISGILLFFLLRRRRHQQQNDHQQNIQYNMQQMNEQKMTHEMHASSHRHEAPGNYPTNSNVTVELAG